ncbi:hypothetical protein Tco_0895338 [Tanacetum coccineum]|uniref:Uncharacterized protein n=1 Tax=Tanacetum coccineum TaxID=301880 RepID=A0ABQ5CEB0_9ASTR
MTRSSTKELITPFENPERVFRSKRRLFETHGLVESSSPKFDLFYDIKKEETTEIMTETMEQYMSKTRGNYGSRVSRPKINDKTHFELKGQFLKELHENTFSGSEHEDANENIKKSLRFRKSLAQERTIRIDYKQGNPENEVSKQVLRRTAKKMEEINNFQQELDEILFRAWERFKELLMKYPDSKGTIPTKIASDAKVAIQEMAEYS